MESAITSTSRWRDIRKSGSETFSTAIAHEGAIWLVGLCIFIILFAPFTSATNSFWFLFRGRNHYGRYPIPMKIRRDVKHDLQYRSGWPLVKSGHFYFLSTGLKYASMIRGINSLINSGSTVILASFTALPIKTSNTLTLPLL
jgi:hypothetical protein